MDKNIIKMAKSLKRQIVEITPQYICGSDTMMCSFSIIYLDGSIPIDANMYYFGLANAIDKDVEDYDILRLKPKMDYLRKTCIEKENGKVIFITEDIKNNDSFISSFNDSIKLKAKDGAMLLKTENGGMFMTSSPSIYPVNKSDKIDAIGYEYDDKSYLMRCIIYKKNYTINSYIRYLYI